MKFKKFKVQKAPALIERSRTHSAFKAMRNKDFSPTGNCLEICDDWKVGHAYSQSGDGATLL